MMMAYWYSDDNEPDILMIFLPTYNYDIINDNNVMICLIDDIQSIDMIVNANDIIGSMIISIMIMIMIMSSK